MPPENPFDEAQKNHEAHARAREQRRKEQAPLVTVRMAAAALRSAADDLCKSDGKARFDLSQRGQNTVWMLEQYPPRAIRLFDLGMLVKEIAQVLDRPARNAV